MKILLLVLLFAMSGSVVAAIEVSDFDSEQDYERYRNLAHQLSCPKCQHQSIIDSDADISEDMRRRTAMLIREGYSDREVIDYFKARYGDFVHYQPPLRGNTLLLWLGPGVVLLIGFGLVLRQLKRAALAADDDEDLETDDDQRSGRE